ncbi:MAG TPA: hypothetical protein VF456_22715 [Vicinamibacterales bacterium]
MRGPFAGALVALVVTITAPTSQAQPPVIPAANRARAGEFVEQLKHAVDAADRRAVSSMVTYPLTVFASGFTIPVKDATSFTRLYESVFTPELRCAVVASEMPSGAMPPTRRSVTITPDALSMVEGAIWAPFKDGRYRITRIRVLPPAPSVEGRKGIERVTFEQPKGQRSATYAGWLVRQNVDAYVVALRKGETIQARIEGFRGHDASLRLTPHSPGGARPTLPIQDVGRSSAATATADSEYFVEVAHLAHYCDPPQRYKLTLTIR